MTHETALAEARAALGAAGIASAATDARLLLASATGLDMAALIAHGPEALPSAAEARFHAHMGRRRTGEPVARILGEKEFWGLSFEVDASTLVPRPETETLVEAVLERLADRRADPITILDLGTGSGCILGALLQECPQATGLGIDASGGAVAVARRNLRRLGLDGRASMRVGDWLAGVIEKADVVVSNPPYVAEAEFAGLTREVRDFEPRAALAGGADGLDCYRAILAGIGAAIMPGGLVVFEVGAGQAESVADLMARAGFRELEVRLDLSGIARSVGGRA